MLKHNVMQATLALRAWRRAARREHDLRQRYLSLLHRTNAQVGCDEGY